MSNDTKIARSKHATSNDYADACVSLGLSVAEVPCLVYSKEVGGDPYLWCEGREYEYFAVGGDGYCVPSGEPVIGPPPKIRFVVSDMPKMALHWRR